MHTPMFSLEVFPPKRTSPVGTIYDTLDGLNDMKPDFISVTYGTGKSADRTATARIAHTIHSEYGIDAVAHLTAQYLTARDVDEALAMFDEAKVSGVLALRGDRNSEREPAGVFTHASDLVCYIRERRPNLKIYGACYPEKHPQAATLDEDVAHLKAKVDAGASHLISQLFYDDDDFIAFLGKARAAGIDVPIEAGIMPVTNAKSVRRMTNMCSSRVPRKLERMLEKWGRRSQDATRGGHHLCERADQRPRGSGSRWRAPVHDEPSVGFAQNMAERGQSVRKSVTQFPSATKTR